MIINDLLKWIKNIYWFKIYVKINYKNILILYVISNYDNKNYKFKMIKNNKNHLKINEF